MKSTLFCRLNKCSLVTLTLLLNFAMASASGIPDSLYQQIQPSSPDSVRAFALNKLARQHMFSSLDSSFIYSNRALDIATAIQDSLNIIYSHLCLGDFYGVKDDFYLALKYYQDGLMLLTYYRHPRLYNAIQNNLGNLFSDLERNDKALECYLSTISYYEEQKSWKHLAHTYNNIGQSYYRIEKDDSAKFYFEKSIAISREHHLYSATSKNNYAGLLLRQNKLEEAKYLLLESIEEKKSLNQINRLPPSYIQLSQIAMIQGQSDSALLLLETAFEISSNAGLFEFMTDIMHELAKVHHELGNLDTSIGYYEKHLVFKDSLLWIDKDRELNTLKEKHKLDKEQIALAIEMKKTKWMARNAESWNILLGITLLITLVSLFMSFKYYRSRKKNSKELERQIEVHTRDLLKKNEMLATYASMNAHKVRGPLARLMGLINVLNLKEEHTKEELQLYLNLLVKSAKELDAVIESINSAISEERSDGIKMDTFESDQT